MDKETRLLLAIVLSFLFMTVEFIGGYIANSIAIYSDAAHLLTDVAGFLIALIATITAKHKGSRHLTYGYVRAEVLGALFSIISLWIITVYLFYEASCRTLSWFSGNGEAVDGFFMFLVAVFGIMVNISLGLLFQDEHGGEFHPGHSHDHAHGSAIEDHHDDDHDDHNDHNDHDHDHNDHDHDHNHNTKPTISTETSPLLTASYKSSNTDAQPFSFVKQQQQQQQQHHDHDHNRKCDNHQHDHDHKPVSDKHDHKHEHSSHIDLESDQNVESTVIHPPPHHDNHNSHVGSHDSHGHGRDVNLEAAYMHVITDLIQSIGVAIAGAIIWRYPSFQIIDPLCTFIFGYIALTATIPLTKKIVMILFEGVPSNVEWDSVMKGLVSIPHVEDVHDLHIWSINTNSTSLTCHIRTKDPDNTLRSAHSICKKFGIDHVTIQVHDITKGSNQYCYSSVCDASSSFNIHSSIEGNDVKPCSLK